MIEASGWAVIENGEINVRSVSPTRRAAIVNFIATDRGVMHRARHTDALIEDVWQKLKGDADVFEIRITQR